MSALAKRDHPRKGFRRLAGPYFRKDEWMLRGVIADLVRGEIAYQLQVLGTQTWVWRSAHGWVESESEAWQTAKLLEGENDRLKPLLQLGEETGV